MSDEPGPIKDQGLHIGGGVAKKAPNPTPKAITAQSQARNSFAVIVIVGTVLTFLCVILLVMVVYRPEHVRDVLLLVGTVVGYLVGSIDFSRRDEK